MPEFGTIAHLIELAIQGERLSETFYQRLARMFNNHPDVAEFWNGYAAEENGHARWLIKLRERSSAEQLSQPADPMVLEQAERALATPIDALLADVKTLQNAYEVANELEHSETNVVFEFLISYFAQDEQTQIFLRAQLSDHVGRLMIDFPKRLGTGTLRRGIQSSGE
jgi:rubrerythrin